MGAVNRVTVYLHPSIHSVLKVKSAESDQTVSSIINQAVCEKFGEEAIEDALDLQAIEERRNEPSRPFDDVLRDMKRDGLCV